MKLTIHRGTHEIGGSCVELEASGTRLILDMGMPLSGPKGTPFELPRNRSIEELVAERILPDIPGLYGGPQHGDTALIISHAHQDHYGLAGFVRPEIPVYCSAGTQALLDVSSLFLPRAVKIKGLQVLPKEGPFGLLQFQVTPILVDHSAPDALALVVEADKTRVLYSGDLRAHGRKSGLFRKLLREPPAAIDVLLLEGTTLGRDTPPKYPNEQAVADRIVEVLKGCAKIAVMVCSSQNLDRLVSAYRAATTAGALLVIDPYTAYVLDRLQCISSNIPQHHWPNVRVLWCDPHMKVLKRAGKFGFLKSRECLIAVDDLKLRRGKALVLAKDNRLFPDLATPLLDAGDIEFIWSMWEGYWTDKTRTSFMRQLCEERGITPHFIHTSGHATAKDLQALVEAIKPRYVTPIHTERRERYKALFPHVLSLDDRETKDLSALP